MIRGTLSDERVNEVSCGAFHVLALAQGTSIDSSERTKLFSWGRNDQGQAAALKSEKVLFPTDITASFKFTEQKVFMSISAGKMHSGVVTEDNECYTWGCNEMGQLGVSSIEKNCNQPERVTELEVDVAKITCGYNQTIFLTDQGAVLACGYNELGQLGVDEESEIVDIPIPVSGIEESIAEVYCTNFVCALSMSRSLYIWGDTPNGMFVKPEKINGLAEIISQVAIGEDLICIMDINNFVYAWGRNESGQLGLGDTEPQKDACSIEALNEREVSRLFAGKNFVIALGMGKANKMENPLLASAGDEDEQLIHDYEDNSQPDVDNKEVWPDLSKGQEETENDIDIREDEGTNEYELVGTETFGGKKTASARSYEVEIEAPNEGKTENGTKVVACL